MEHGKTDNTETRGGRKHEWHVDLEKTVTVEKLGRYPVCPDWARAMLRRASFALTPCSPYLRYRSAKGFFPETTADSAAPRTAFFSGRCARTGTPRYSGPLPLCCRCKPTPRYFHKALLLRNLQVGPAVAPRRRRLRRGRVAGWAGFWNWSPPRRNCWREFVLAPPLRRRSCVQRMRSRCRRLGGGN